MIDGVIGRGKGVGMKNLILLVLVLLLPSCLARVDAGDEPSCSAAFDECSMATGALVIGDRCRAEVGPTGHYVDVTCPVTGASHGEK